MTGSGSGSGSFVDAFDWLPLLSLFVLLVGGCWREKLRGRGREEEGEGRDWIKVRRRRRLVIFNLFLIT